MSSYITEDDGQEAVLLARRWENCSKRAKMFATRNAGRYAPILPHVLAEIFDAGYTAERSCDWCGRSSLDEVSDQETYKEENK
jgi:hypothetical protein